MFERFILVTGIQQTGLLGCCQSTLGFKNSAESDTTRLSCNRLQGDCIESDTRYDTITNSTVNQPNSDDSAEISS